VRSATQELAELRSFPSGWGSFQLGFRAAVEPRLSTAVQASADSIQSLNRALKTVHCISTRITSPTHKLAFLKKFSLL